MHGLRRPSLLDAAAALTTCAAVALLALYLFSLRGYTEYGHPIAGGKIWLSLTSGRLSINRVIYLDAHQPNIGDKQELIQDRDWPKFFGPLAFGDSTSRLRSEYAHLARTPGKLKTKRQYGVALWFGQLTFLLCALALGLLVWWRTRRRQRRRGFAVELVKNRQDDQE